jgi:flagellar biosynthesis/type III secretory pathway protein FliH
MAYVTTVERRALARGREEGLEQGREEGLEQGREEGLEQGREEGVRQGLLKGLEVVLELRFGEAGEALLNRVQALQDTNLIQQLFDAIKSGVSLDDLTQMLEKP